MTLEWYYMEEIHVHVYTAGSRDRVIWFTGRQNYVDLCKRRISNRGVFPYDKGTLCILTCCRLLIMCEWLILIDWLIVWTSVWFIYRTVYVMRVYTYMYMYMNLKLQWYSYCRYWYSLKKNGECQNIWYSYKLWQIYTSTLLYWRFCLKAV